MTPPHQTSNKGEVVALRPRLLSISNAAVYGNTSRSTLYAEEKAGRIKFVKIDSATRVELAEMDRWIDEKIASSSAA